MNAEPPVVLKLGGAVLADPQAVAAVWRDVAAAPLAVVVHGGGPQATALARRLGHEPQIVAGRRVTTDLDLDVALYTLRGALNARLVASASGTGVRAVGLSGIDGGAVRVRRRPPVEVDGRTVDFGWVGDVAAVDTAVLAALMEAGFVPVMASVCADLNGDLFNVNADTVAMEIAVALEATLSLVTEAGGVRRDPSNPESTIRQLDGAEIDAGVAEGWIAGGMRPKLETARAALARGVRSVRICAPGDLDGGTAILP